MPLSEKQLAARQFRLGASEIATIFGDNPWCSPTELWARKTGRLLSEEQFDSEAIELGNLLEPVLLDWAEDLEGVILERNVEFQAERLPVVATLDGWNPVRRRVIEAKTACLVHASRESLAHWTDDSFPNWYWWQIQTQMLCAKADSGLLVALIGGRGRKSYEVEPDREQITEAVATAVKWWDLHVGLDTQPQGDLDAVEILRNIKANTGELVELDDLDAMMVDRALQLAEEAKEIERQIETLKDHFVLKLGLATEGLLPDGRTITFRETNRSAFSVAAKKFRPLRLPRAKKAKQ